MSVVFMTALAFRMLERALKDIVRQPGGSHRASICILPKHPVGVCAREWVSGEVQDPVFSFENCCDLMGWEPTWARPRILNATSNNIWVALGLRRGVVKEVGLLGRQEVREALWKHCPEAALPSCPIPAAWKAAVLGAVERSQS